jgi:hypothetical protein
MGQYKVVLFDGERRKEYDNIQKATVVSSLTSVTASSREVVQMAITST